MSTRDEAIRVIREQTLVSGLATSKDIARKLEYAGLLAPDLPEPDVDNGVHRVYTAVDNLDVVSVTGHVQLNRLESDGRTAVWDGKPAAARAFAHALLAAADHAEGNRE